MIIGVNKFRLDHEDSIDILSIDNTEVRKKQIERIQQLKENRNEDEVNHTLHLLTKAAASGEGNLLELAVEAARKRATLGEISFAIEKVSKRHQAMIRSISGVYSSEYSNDEEIKRVRERTDQFYELEGRRPRILIAKMGQDGHDRGQR